MGQTNVLWTYCGLATRRYEITTVHSNAFPIAFGPRIAARDTEEYKPTLIVIQLLQNRHRKQIRTPPCAPPLGRASNRWQTLA